MFHDGVGLLGRLSHSPMEKCRSKFSGQHSGFLSRHRMSDKVEGSGLSACGAKHQIMVFSRNVVRLEVTSGLVTSVEVPIDR